MSSTAWKLTAAIALLLSVLLILWTQIDRPDSSDSISPVTSVEGQSSRGGLDRLPEVALARSVVLPPPLGASKVESAASESEGESNDPKEFVYGSVHGRLYGEDSLLIPRGRISFLYDGGDKSDLNRGVFGNYRSVSTSLEGEYRQRLSTGPWNVYFSGMPTQLEKGLTLMGRILVEEDQDQQFDIFLLGNRIFSGGFYHGTEDQILLPLELSLAYDRSKVVAKSSCITSLASYEEYEVAIAEVNPDVSRRKTDRPPGRGSFRVTRLPADVYEMRVFLDVDRKYNVTARVDLTTEDKIIKPIELNEIDFLTHRVLDL